jgi:hypothetical protein
MVRRAGRACESEDDSLPAEWAQCRFQVGAATRSGDLPLSAVAI